MEYVNFGTAGVRISRLALGLGLRGQADEKQAERLILKAFDGGITLFDCANVYGLMDDRAYAGRSEVVLGRALKRRRDDVVITSKVYSPIGSGPNDRGASRYHMMREVERSLRRLDTDHIDVYLLHHFDPTTPLEEQFRALDDLVRQGKIRYAGVCNYLAWEVCRALWVQERINAAPLITVQNPYSLLNRHLEREMFPLVRSLGLGIMAYAPLATGLLSGAYQPGQEPAATTLWGSDRRRGQLDRLWSEQVREVVSAVRDIAARYDATMAQVALKWILSRPEITVAISGADTDAQMEENLKAVEINLTQEDLDHLTALSEGSSLFLDGSRAAGAR